MMQDGSTVFANLLQGYSLLCRDWTRGKTLQYSQQATSPNKRKHQQLCQLCTAKDAVHHVVPPVCVDAGALKRVKRMANKVQCTTYQLLVCFPGAALLQPHKKHKHTQA
jgi:hypothetical protein